MFSLDVDIKATLTIRAKSLEEATTILNTTVTTSPNYREAGFYQCMLKPIEDVRDLANGLLVSAYDPLTVPDTPDVSLSPAIEMRFNQAYLRRSDTGNKAWILQEKRKTMTWRNVARRVLSSYMCRLRVMRHRGFLNGEASVDFYPGQFPEAVNENIKRHLDRFKFEEKPYTIIGWEIYRPAVPENNNAG